MMKQTSMMIFDDMLFVSVRSKEKKKGLRIMRDLEPSIDERLRNLQTLTSYRVEKEQ